MSTSTSSVPTSAVSVEKKLFMNRYLVDSSRPHIVVTAHETPDAKDKTVDVEIRFRQQ